MEAKRGNKAVVLAEVMRAGPKAMQVKSGQIPKISYK